MAGSAASTPGGRTPPGHAQALFAAGLFDDAQPGDLVFRKGAGWRAQAVRAASGNELTHVGIIDRDEDGELRVIHADPPHGNRPGFVRSVPVAEFATADGVTGVVLKHLRLSSKARRNEVAFARDAARKQVSFDDAFDLSDAQSIYCTELVWRSLMNADIPMPVRTTHIDIPWIDGDYMTPENLLHMLKIAGLLETPLS